MRFHAVGFPVAGLLLAALAAVIPTVACQDAPPDDYIERYTVQGYLFANHGLDSIFIRRSLPVTAYYDPAQAAVHGATVLVSVDGTTYALQEDTARPDRYFLPRAALTVLSGKTYVLEVHIGDHVLRAQTHVPDSIHFTQRPPDTLAYPSDPNQENLPACTIGWTDVRGRIDYALAVSCLDTLFLTRTMVDTVIDGRDTTIPTGPANARIWRWWEHMAPFYDDATRYGAFLDVSSGPLPWSAFKWYGRQRLTVYAVDTNMYDWMRIMFLGSSYRPQLNHIDGGVGVFGSAAIDTALFFVKKPS